LVKKAPVASNRGFFLPDIANLADILERKLGKTAEHATH